MDVPNQPEDLSLRNQVGHVRLGANIDNTASDSGEAGLEVTEGAKSALNRPSNAPLASALPDSNQAQRLTPNAGGAGLNEWQQKGVDRILELYKGRTPQLKRMLRDFRLALEHRNVRRSGSRSITARDCAIAAVVYFGQDLLADKERRLSLAKAAGAIEAPKRWSSGKSSSRRFTEELGLPQEFAGRAFADPRRDIEVLDGRPLFKGLEAYQEEVCVKIVDKMHTPSGRAMVELPTGAGKTRVAMEAIRRWLQSRGRRNDTILWLAHSEELCEQAASDARSIWQGQDDSPKVELVRYWGKFTTDTDARDFLAVLESPEPQILISTPQRIKNAIVDENGESPSLASHMILHSGVIVIDEAHRSAAPTYKAIVDVAEKCNTDCSIVGLTATPYRKEYLEPADKGTLELRKIFRDLVDPAQSLKRPYHEALRQKGVLAKAVFGELPTGCRIRVKSDDEWRIEDSLKTKADTPKRREKIISRLLELAQSEDARVLYFGPTVSDAKAVAFQLVMEGIRAAAVDGDTHPGTRQTTIDDFRAGKIRVLCNCQVLTTGFDAPRVTHVVIGRPTTSQVLFEQMIGRGLRGPRFGGTDRCEIIVCVDEHTGAPLTMGYQRHLDVWRGETA